VIAIRPPPKDEKRLDVEKFEAAKLEGMMAASRMYLKAIADYIRDNVPEAHRRPFLVKVGTAMAELLDVSWTLHDMYPDLDPDAEHRRRPPDSPS
jgi:hypothetical protein